MTRAGDAFQRKYSATPFDENSRFDRVADQSRAVLLAAFTRQLRKINAQSGDDVQAVAGGLLVGLVQIMMSHSEQTDANHAHIRAGLLELVPWAVDISRQQYDLPPLVLS